MSNENSLLRLSEDWAASIVGLMALSIALAACFFTQPSGVNWNSAQENASQLRQEEANLSVSGEQALTREQQSELVKSRKKSTLEKLGITWTTPGNTGLAKIEAWVQNPLDAFRKPAKGQTASSKDWTGEFQWKPMLITFLILFSVGSTGSWLKGHQILPFIIAFPGLFLLAVLAYLLASQTVIKYYNFEYPLWALLVGMIVCNTVGTPKWLAPVVCGELFIKTGLVLLGGEVLLSQLLALGLPGIFVSWVVTPIVLIATYAFGQKILKLGSRSLNMVISADMSVCGVSAAIATAAACKAKKEELSLAIGLSLTFTAIMMVAMPQFVKWIELPPRIAGAWMGGTIDSTGAVAAAGETLGIVGFETAVTVKMIQNILIGAIAFGVAVYWSRWVETAEKMQDLEAKSNPPAVGFGEIWIRFPKFVIGFVAASLAFSAISRFSFFGESWIQLVTSKLTSPLRGWLFCLAFVSIGLSTNFRELAPYLKAGKPLALYVCGQTLNLILTLAMAYLMFGQFYEWMAS